MRGRARAVRWAVIACQVLAVPSIALALILHFDTSLARSLSELGVGALTVSAVFSCVAVVSTTWSYFASAISFLRKREKGPYKPPGDPVSRRIEIAAAELGAALRGYAEDEIIARGLKAPAPLPVRWRRVNTRHGTDGGLRAVSGVHSDKIGAIIALLLRDSARRFVLIGPPGSGKTAVTLFFQRDLVGTGPEDPVPFTLSLSTWNPPTPLVDWAAARLEERYPKFAEPVAPGRAESMARSLIRGNRVRLILDAMDELPAELLSQVFGALNNLGPEFPVIVTCRTADYAKARQSASGEGQAWELEDAPVFELLPPSAEEIRKYLGAAMNPESWHLLFEYLDVDGFLSRALSTPLMVWLTRRVYQRQPGLLAQRLEAGLFLSTSALESHLLDNLVEEVYGKASREERHLRFLARHVTARTNSRYQLPSGQDLITLTDNGQDIAWWRLVHDRRTRLTDWILLVLIGGLAPGGALGLGWAVATWNWLGHPAALLSGIALGGVSTAVMTAGCLRNNPPPAGTRFTKPGPVRAPAVVLCFALAVGGAASLAMTGSLTSACFALIIAMPVALAYTFTNPYVDARRVETPRRHYRADVQQSFVYFAAYALGIGAYTALFRPWPLALGLALLTGISGGFTYGAGYKLAYGRNMPSGMVAFLRFRVAHARLALTGRLPWRYFAFLEEAHQHGVLRRSGASYQFSHVRLRDRLALAPPAVPPK